MKEPADELKSPFFLSRLLLATGGLGRRDFEYLEPLAVGLELLEFGVKSHYQLLFSGNTADFRIGNLSLISGDYYYSKGISFAARLGRSDFVETMSQAIVEVTEGQAGLAGIETYKEDDFFDKYGSSLSKLAGLCRAACKLGTSAGESDEGVSETINAFGDLVGILQILLENSVWTAGSRAFYKQKIKTLAEEATKIVETLAESDCRRYLAGMVEEMTFSKGGRSFG